MNPMESPTKPGIMSNLRNSKGFSLVEMALVLVIIGIIIAAVIKGQDLMVNARAKQLISTANAWKISTYAYMDRNGRFPGDFTKDGNIGSSVEEQAIGSTAIDEITSTLTQAPANPVVIGGQTFWFYLGTTPTATSQRNAIVICKSKDCTSPLAGDDFEMFKALDTALDGSSDAGIGAVRAITVLPTAGVDNTSALITVGDSNNSRANGIAYNITTADTSSVGATLTWSGTQYGAIWTFDTPY